jgi:hypothetical protein
MSIKTWDDILNQRLCRVRELSRLGGRLGAVSPALAAFLLGLSKSRTRDLIESGELPEHGYAGFRLVTLNDVLEFARASNRRMRRRLRGRTSRGRLAQAQCRCG